MRKKPTETPDFFPSFAPNLKSLFSLHQLQEPRDEAFRAISSEHASNFNIQWKQMDVQFSTLKVDFQVAGKHPYLPTGRFWKHLY